MHSVTQGIKPLNSKCTCIFSTFPGYTLVPQPCCQVASRSGERPHHGTCGGNQVCGPPCSCHTWGTSCLASHSQAMAGLAHNIHGVAFAGEGQAWPAGPRLFSASSLWLSFLSLSFPVCLKGVVTSSLQQWFQVVAAAWRGYGCFPNKVRPLCHPQGAHKHSSCWIGMQPLFCGLM